MTFKTFNIADTNLLSGSAELIRQTLGGYYDVSDTDFVGEEVEDIESFTNGYITDIDSNYAETSEPVDQYSLIKSVKFATRFYGTSNEDTVRSDEEWKDYIVGGSFADNVYPGIYDNSIHFDHRVRIQVPLYQNEINSDSQTISGYSRPEYYNFYERYQQNLPNVDSEILIPNYYFLFAGDNGDADVQKFVNLEGDSEVSNILFDYTTDDTRTPRYEYPHIEEYLNVEYVNHNFSEELQDSLQNKLQNIMFLDEVPNRPSFDVDLFGAPEFLLEEPNSSNRASDLVSFSEDIRAKMFSLMPMSNHIQFETDQDNFNKPIRNLINTNDYTPFFIKTLKEVFTDEIPLKPLRLDFAIDNENAQQTNTVTLNVVDFPQLLVYNLRNTLSATDNYVFYGQKTEETEATYDTDGTHRFVNSEIITNTLNDIVARMNSQFTTDEQQTLKDFLNSALKLEKHYESLAYRIQKIGGPPTGDSRTENTIQNFWFFNRSSAIEYIDTQVKYGTTYTYKIFAYVAIQGFKYRLSDLLVTRQLATQLAQESDRPLEQCLEFYDPITGQAAVNLFDPASVILENPLTTGAQIKTDRRYLSDLNLNIEPSLKIVEVPIQEKTFKILDNPPNDLVATPHHLKDQSNRLAFFLSYDTFSPDSVVYPATLTTTDDENRTDYLFGNDLDAEDFIQYESVSRPVAFEVYRLSEMPTSYQDFEDNLRKTIDLRILKQGNAKLDAMFMEKVKPNQKYYYTFRVLNENGIAGEFTPIFEAELINDGGYVYGSFNQLTAEDLIVDQISEPLMSFKKLFNVVPNIQHLILDSDNVDFSDSAFSQVGNFQLGAADDEIWGKTFKLRLTSKKTGKKIDLNIKFNKTNG